MKFKKFLCLTLTTTIAFTATLGSSASIFADDIDIQETDGSQNFGSLILEKMKNEYENSNDNTISIVLLFVMIPISLMKLLRTTILVIYLKNT